MYYSNKKIEVLKDDNKTNISIMEKGKGYIIEIGEKIRAYAINSGNKKKCDAKPILKQYGLIENLLNYCPI